MVIIGYFINSASSNYFEFNDLIGMLTDMISKECKMITVKLLKSKNFPCNKISNHLNTN